MSNKTIYLAGGCFWGAEHFFQQLGGITGTRTGFANGNTENPTYKEVYTDTTGYAETVKIDYNPTRISLEKILNMFFMIIDPTSLNCQGEDHGTRYRTGIYFTDPAELDVIQKVYAQQEAKVAREMQSEGLEPKPLAVEVEPLRNWYSAEDYHQDYLNRNPDGYCHLPLKTFVYAKLASELELLLGDEPDIIARMSNTVAMIHGRLRFWWTGFYLVRPSYLKEGEELVLGPFQGPEACFRISKGRGVCGTAWAENRTVVVPNVHEFPGHIACSSLSNSEIVVPVYDRDGNFAAELDIDSKEFGTFDKTDRDWLELIVKMIYNY